MSNWRQEITAQIGQTLPRKRISSDHAAPTFGTIGGACFELQDLTDGGLDDCDAPEMEVDYDGARRDRTYAATIESEAGPPCLPCTPGEWLDLYRRCRAALPGLRRKAIWLANTLGADPRARQWHRVALSSAQGEVKRIEGILLSARSECSRGDYRIALQIVADAEREVSL